MKMKKKGNAKIRSENENSDKNISDYQINKRFYHSPVIRKSFDLLVQEELLTKLLILSIRLGVTLDIMIKSLTNIDDVFSSFNHLLNSKCKFYFDSNRVLCYDFTSWENYEDSPEQLLIVILGICAAFRINLEFQEGFDDNLKGINEFLLAEFPETYKTYDVLSKQFDFTTSVRIYGKPIAGKLDISNQIINN